MTKVNENREFLQEVLNKGREHCFKGEIPHQGCITRCPEVLAIAGNRVYLQKVTK